MDLDRGEEAAAAHLLDEREVGLELLQPRRELQPAQRRALAHVLLHEHLQRLRRQRRRQRRTAERRPVRPRLEHHVLRVRQHRRDGHHATAQRLGQDDHVGAHLLVLHRQHLARAPEARLHLVVDVQDVVLRAQLAHRLQVARRRDHDAGLALDRLADEAADRLAVLLEHLLQLLRVAVLDADEPGQVRPVLRVRRRVVRHRDRAERAAVEVARAAHDLGLVGRDLLLLVPPLAGELQRRLDALGAGVHREHLLVPEQLRDVLGVLAELHRVKSAGDQGDTLDLLHDGAHEAGVAVALGHGAVAAEEVKVAVALRGEHGRLGRLGEDDGKRLVVGGAEALLFGDDQLGLGHLRCRRRRRADPNAAQHDGGESGGEARIVTQ
mmetsp:Transcript_27198/g.84276  ORF Transcript_27198/g.84276 Transcript_27198/m.84276 type:complete len:381 (-) Transcript_27198:22-1164(-)